MDDSSLIPEPINGHLIIRVNMLGTVVFIISSVLAATVFTPGWRTQGVVVDLALFTIGVIAFLWGYWTAVQRSRNDDIAVASLYFLTSGVAPRNVSRLMNGAMALQVIVAISTAMSRPNTDGKPGSTLAFGILVPILGLGLNGLWAAQHGAFGPRTLKPSATGESEVQAMPDSESQTGQDKHHD